MKIHSPMVSGSGALIVHKQLAQSITDYQLSTFSPKAALFPPYLLRYRNSADVIHTAPDFGPFPLNRESINILTFHNYYLDDFILSQSSLAQQYFYRFVLKPSIISALKKADVVTAVSDATASLVKPILPKGLPLIVIKNGVDELQFCPPAFRDNEKVKILFAGNPTRRKGLALLIQIAEAVGAKAEILCTQGMRTVNVPDKIKSIMKFIPRVPHHQMHQIYQSADIFLFPSLREGLSLVLLEAMACGLPVVTTKISSMPELIDHESGGFLCDHLSSDQMLSGVLRLIASKNLRHDMGSYNREKIEKHFRLSGMINAYQTLFSTTQKR